MSETTQNKFEKYKPAVTTKVLLLIAGLVWMGTGIMLISIAIVWLSKAISINIYVYAGTGVILAMLIHHFGFLKIVDKNIERILEMKDKRCLFSFVPWKSYLIIIVMIAMGITLRHSAIPKEYLSIIYIGIGLALFLSSVRYLRIYYREMRRNHQ
jgi:uncharacterized membrane protein